MIFEKKNRKVCYFNIFTNDAMYIINFIIFLHFFFYVTLYTHLITLGRAIDLTREYRYYLNNNLEKGGKKSEENTRFWLENVYSLLKHPINTCVFCVAYGNGKVTPIPMWIAILTGLWCGTTTSFSIQITYVSLYVCVSRVVRSYSYRGIHSFFANVNFIDETSSSSLS